MTKSKKFNIFILSFMLVLASFLFIACGEKDYSKIYLSSSEEYVELFAKEEPESKNITITINNPVKDMDKELKFYLSNPAVCSVEQIKTEDYSTTYALTGIKGGNTTIDFVSQEGAKKTTVNVTVKEYTDILERGDNSLYVSASKALEPTSADFVFKNEASERDLSYYFYGKTSQKDLLNLGDVQNDNVYINKFTKVELYSVLDKDYLIFTDENNGYFTLGREEFQAGNNNTKYSFIDVEKQEESYNFIIDNATSVSAGDKFTFVAVYEYEDLDEIFYCERDFSVIIDLDKESISFDYGYKVEGIDFVKGSDSTSYKNPNAANTKVILIPNYVTGIMNGQLIGEKANFVTAYLEVSINSVNELIKMSTSVSDENIINSNVLGTTVNNGKTTYYIQVNCSSGRNASTNFNLNFYYEGFENSKDDNVNCLYSIPVEIKIIPIDLLVNNINLNEISKEFTFYNKYPSSITGWQEFVFSVSPEGGEYNNLTIDLRNSNLKISYNNNEYYDEVITINDLKKPVYIKGIDDGEPKVGRLPVSLNFDVISPDHIDTYINYKLLRGVDKLLYKTEEYEKNGLFLDVRNQEPAKVKDIYADAEFSSMTFSLDTNSNDVVNFIYNEREPYILEGIDYYLNFSIIPKAKGNGSYIITLDNGKQIPIKVNVEESLNEISIETSNPENIIKNREDTVINDNQQASLLYVLNNENSPYFDISVLAYNDSKSTAITSVNIASDEKVEIGQTTNNNKNFNVYLMENGSSQIVLTINGYKFDNFGQTDQFKSVPDQKTYIINVVAFDYINKLNVYKLHDGLNDEYNENTNSAYADVYSNTSSQSLRTLNLKVEIENKDSYLFASPQYLSFERYDETTFNENYIYWRANTSITKAGVSCDTMYISQGNAQSNIYSLGNIGTFDASNMTFIADRNLRSQTSLVLYAHVRQFNRTYTYTINVRISIYEEVERVTLQNSISELEFSNLKRENSLISYAVNKNATNPEITVMFEGGEISKDGSTYKMFLMGKNDKDITLSESDGRYLINLKVRNEFVENAVDYQDKIQGTLIIVAKDWLDSGNNIIPTYSDRALRINVRYANGTKENRFTIESGEDLIQMKSNLSAHYQIKNQIDASSISASLPLGELKGSIIGTSEYSSIVGINIKNSIESEGENNYGLFTKLSQDAFIEYITFEGEINISLQKNNSNIGLIAGINNGRIINVNVLLNLSTVYMNYGNVGGIVGINNGGIIQDFTLFERNTSKTRSENAYALKSQGRLTYELLTPKTTLFMKDFLNVYYNISNDQVSRIGGICGFNNGLIKKIDSYSNEVTTSGYTNYMAYSLIRTNPLDLSSTFVNTYVGALVGENNKATKTNNVTNGGQIIGGYNQTKAEDEPVEFTPYTNFTTDINGDNYYLAGKGIVVGGEVWGYGYVSGGVGYIDELSSSTSLTGITSRTFVRGLNNGVAANVSSIAYINTISEGSSLTTAFAIQAVDDGKLGEESSMIIIYSGSKTSVLENYLNSTDYIAFGSKIANVMSSLRDEVNDKDYQNVYTYVISREDRKGENLIVDSSNKNYHYGDVVIVGTNGRYQVVLGQTFFRKGSKETLSTSAKFGNQMTGEGENVIYYTYYFKATSLNENSDISNAQTQLDTYLNNISANGDFYPFITSGEMSFSTDSDVLSFDANGKLTVKKTGLAKITATSILNSNNGLNFYIYVVNYFNSQSTIEDNEQKTSIIFADASSSTEPYDETTIYLRGNNSATIYVVPNYLLNKDIRINSDITSKFNSNIAGTVLFNNIVFGLASNNEVSASVVVDEKGGLTNDMLDIDIVGSIISIKNNSSTVEGEYDLIIQPFLQLKFPNGNENIFYTANINKKLTLTKVDYKYGATSIENNHYNEAEIHTSLEVNDEIIIESTDEEEKEPLFIIRNDELGYYQDNSTNENDSLFIVTFEKSEVSGKNEIGIATIKYLLNVKINKNSTIFNSRFDNNIFGDYDLNLISSSNNTVNKTIKLLYSQTNVTSVIIDNYTNLNDMSSSNGLPSTSEYAYPGLSGMLEITVNPEESDFDYILIENADENYNQGRATANFGLLARNRIVKGESNLFINEMISGSVTDKGLKLTLDNIISIYNDSKTEDDEQKYYPYQGIIYIQYDMGSYNVVDQSYSQINVSFVKDGKVIKEVPKRLRIKLQNFVTVTIEDKVGDYNQADYYVSYNVARGLKYKLNVNSYGFQSENIEVTLINASNGNEIIKEGDEYYLQITPNNINYSSNENVFEIQAIATQKEGDIERVVSSKTRIEINEYVLNYDGRDTKNADIVEGMSEGVINVQVGTQITFSLDLYDYIEYYDVPEITSKIQSFLREFAEKGKWIAYTNLEQDDEVQHKSAPEPEEYEKEGNKLKYYNVKESGKNYYFNYRDLNIIPVKTNEPRNNYYYFTFDGYFKTENGVYTIDTSENEGKTDVNRVTTRFSLNVYTSSSEESPIPIYDYKDFISMQDNGYYILLNDITLPSEANEEENIAAFTPLQGNFASLDGNAHSINWAGTYDMGNLSNIGIFSSLKSNSIIKNLNVNFRSSGLNSDLNTDQNDKYGLNGLRTVTFLTSADYFTFGGIVAQNSGIITNCHINTDENYYIAVKDDNALDNASYVAGLVGLNSGGFITNSSVSANFKAPFNIAGVVAQNNGKVAGCYFKKGKIINNTQFAQTVAGFVFSNGESGQILTSYVSGQNSNSTLQSSDPEESYISSPVPGGGFAFRNSGVIRDCYTDINLSKTAGDMAGFVFYNGGRIKNCFSLSTLRNNLTSSAGFARFNNNENNEALKGTFENCYYYYKEGVKVKDGNGEEISEDGINDAIMPLSYEGIKRLNDDGFANVEENFASYSYTSSISTNAVWFYSDGSTSDIFVDYIPSTTDNVIDTEVVEIDNKTQTNTVYKKDNKIFAKGRLELVNPNISVLSMKNFASSEVDEESGNVIYNYIDESNTPNRGSLHNPILLYSAENMESSVYEQSSSTYLNTNHYRIINDIDYSKFEGMSNLYKVTFAGLLEGNGMKISQISMAVMDRLSSAGFFSQIGYSSNRYGVVKNLTIVPRQVAFTNSNSVGTLAGTLKYGYIYDIHVEVNQGSDVTVTGMNFVGGIIGKATHSFVMQDVYSNINVSSIFLQSTELVYNENNSNDSSYSYAGGIVGFAGSGVVRNAHVNNITAIMGSRIGFAYGGLGINARANYTYVDVDNEASMKAYHYAGFVAGEVVGELNYSYVSDNQSIVIPFDVRPRIPLAVGGIAGSLKGGTISNAIMEQEFRVVNNDSNQPIENVGGIAGIVTTEQSYISTIKNSVVDANIYACSILGGGVGSVKSALEIDNLAIKSNTLRLTGQKINPQLGGIVGYIDRIGSASLKMSDSYCWSDLEIETYTTGLDSTASVGGLIGNDNGRRVELDHCYTTSTINAKVYDAKSLDPMKDYKEYADNNFSEFNYEQIKTAIINDVYYLGTNKSQSDNINKDILDFQTRVKSNVIKLSVTNYGISSTEKTSTSSSTTGTKSDLNNLFVNSFKGEAGDFIYDVYNDTFTEEGNTTGTYEKYANNNDIYRKNTKFDNTLSFFKADGNGYTYSYTVEEIIAKRAYTSTLTFVESEKDSSGNITSVTMLSNSLRKYKLTVSPDGDGKVVCEWLKGEDNSSDNTLNLYKLERFDQIRKSQLLQEKRLKDPKGNYYIQTYGRDDVCNGYCLKRLSDGEHLLKDKTLEGLNSLINELNLKEIWTINPTGLSILSIENDRDWLKKT